MQARLVGALISALVTVLVTAETPSKPQGGWATTDAVFGQQGKDLPGGVHKYAWPRTNLKVVLDGVQLEAGLALGSWAGFLRMEESSQTMAMGDLALLSGEVNPVIRALQAGGMMVAAIHNHLIGETPRVVYVHFEGHGAPESLAKALKTALATTATPTAIPSAPAPVLGSGETEALSAFQKALGVEGNMAGRVLQIGVPRVDPIEEGGMMIPPSLGMACSINVQVVGFKVASTGDFVLAASEVDGVARALEDHGIAVTAIHSHMLNETPRLFFMHFWAVGTPQEVAAGLRAALEHARVQGFSAPAPMKS